MNSAEMKQAARRAVERARSAGAETAEVSVVREKEFSVTVRGGRIENLLEAGSQRIGISLSIGGRTSRVSSTDPGEESIGRLIAAGVQLARIMDRDEYAGLPEAAELGGEGDDLGIYNEETAALPAPVKIAAAAALEREAVAIDPRIISNGASCSTAVAWRAFANSLGFCEAYRKTSSMIAVSCAAEDRPAAGENTGQKQSSWWYSSAVSHRDLEPLEEVAARAVRRTLRKLGAVKPRTREVPVVFDPVTARGLLDSLAAACGGGAIYRAASFLVGRLGERVSSPLVTIVDDPLLPGRLGTRPFDREGVRPRRTVVIDSGVLESYLLSGYQARRLGLKTTGNAGGISNFTLQAGASPPGEIIASIADGLYLTSLSGPGANWSTGDFSQGGQGIWIRGGELAEPVSEFTVAGTFPRLLEGIVMVGDDLEWRGSIGAPSLKIEALTISGIGT